jgi:ElaB/YqjD/DUF883 family membrane-anchored ribosome-binding protein
MSRENETGGTSSVVRQIVNAKAIFDAAATTISTDEAIELRGKAMAAVEDLVRQCEKADVWFKGTERAAFAATAGFVEDNPWKSTLIGAAAGLLAGTVITRLN